MCREHVKFRALLQREAMLPACTGCAPPSQRGLASTPAHYATSHASWTASEIECVPPSVEETTTPPAAKQAHRRATQWDGSMRKRSLYKRNAQDLL